MNRRTLLANFTTLLGAVSVSNFLPRFAKAALPAPVNVWIASFDDSGVRTARTLVPKVVKPDAAWRAQLGDDAYDVTRQAGTEAPYSGKYWNLHAAGLFHCICCNTALYNSKTKFDSGTGWPSFYQPIAEENIRKSIDNTLLMRRTAISCTRCDAHLGHVFDDGPAPTGLRYCMNSVALQFVPHPTV